MQASQLYSGKIGRFKTGERNKITDVPGVTVGHVTLDQNGAQTGVTAILPTKDNVFDKKLIGCAHVINGFGKSTGLVQVEELGMIETPIILTNTLSVGDALRGLVEYKLSRNPKIGLDYGTVNGLVCECNDGYLNEIRAFHVKPAHVHEAIERASEDFEQGAVGAGRGMSAYGLKGGIGSASRVVEVEGVTYTIGVLVLTNMGKLENFIMAGRPIGKYIAELSKQEEMPDKGSIIMVVGTDLPVSTLQMKRISKRAVAGLSRTGSNMGHGSGEIVIGFSTANRISHENTGPISLSIVHDDHMDIAFEAVAEATEEAIINSMLHADTVKGREGNTRKSLKSYLQILAEKQNR